ncbi:MAG: hypothetical protein MUF49_13715 [Oculatellaceae cyanobacterium Prado106]|nr:hypothetical protein [Oculatellaceae cyanobacterium Prado106]
MPKESQQVSWKVWVVISIVTAGLTPLAVEVLPSLSSRFANRLRHNCVAAVNQPQTPLKIYTAPNDTSEGQWLEFLGNKARVTIVGESEGWYRMSEPAKGWVQSDRITGACLRSF